MKRLTVGILAHVDAGKTTLSEAMLYLSGELRRLGRVDHGDAFLDTDNQERERGITIFSKQAMLSLPGMQVTLLDTPGHVDFSAEMERTLQVLDCAILVISGTDGVQAHTRTLWMLLERYGVPTFIFVNKMDLNGVDRPNLLSQLQQRLNSGCIDFAAAPEIRDEAAAMCDEAALEEYLDTGVLGEDTLRRLIAGRKVFPCWFGSALKLQGVEAFLQGLEQYAPERLYGGEFAARIFKVSRDKNERLTWLKVTGGVLRAKMMLRGGAGDGAWEEKADQLRLYSGAKYRVLDEAPAGSVVAVTGLSRTCPGQGLGMETEDNHTVLEPVLNYRLILPEGADPHTVLPKLRQLEEEDPLLRLVWNERWQEIHVRLMGPVQLEVLQKLMEERFGLSVTFGTGSIVYKETIAAPVTGCGHFEPLRHYAETHLLLTPGERGSGVQIESVCPTDQLDLNWQRLVFTHLTERNHPGVLTGSPLTDVKITLTAGRAHLKHTEGGDFRQATYRAVRQALMGAENILLEPWYDFRLEVPHNCVGRAMTDVQNMGGCVDDPVTEGDMTVLTGRGPVSKLQNYWQEVAVYTRGQGRLSCTLRGYEPCHNTDEVIAAIGYEPERDVDNPADSVFCSHGAGINVKWDEAPQHMHVSPVIRLEAEPEEVEAPCACRSAYTGAAQDKELQAIFERTYGKVERRAFQTPPKPRHTELKDNYHIRDQKDGADYLLVDGYNIIFAWEELKALAAVDLAAARGALEDILADYHGFRRCQVILVFDAYKVKRNPGSVEKRNGIHIVYTKEAETADMYIEKTSYRLQKEQRVRVATSDNLEQLIVLGHGALRLSAEAFHAEVEETRGQIAELVRQSNLKNKGGNRAKIKE
ncbi:MAG: TetM/TetW/TetO/TetS family tetracycline resistance ribosomal protection protein [Oscillospiraceae bacterium]|nr:TetM/TetW/TetO/TetS family tetracycline resistance ribosomal protection protein [Oscillospiraceae bacterium]